MLFSPPEPVSGAAALPGSQDGTLLASLLDSAMDAIITVEEGQRIIQYNQAAEKVFGWMAAQMLGLGQPLAWLIPGRFHAAQGAHVTRFGAEAHAIREAEKRRIARELHDELAQLLTALKMDTIWVRDSLPDGGQAVAINQMEP